MNICRTHRGCYFNLSLLKLWTLHLFCFALIFLCSCGYSKEEKQRMEKIAELGKQNAKHYIKEKYGFFPEIDDVQICMERDDSSSRSWANGYVLATVNTGEKIFKVHISGETPTLEGRDDFQFELIQKEAKEYFEALLGYEIYDCYLEYRENDTSDNSFPDCHEDNMIEEWYESGSFEDWMQKYPVNIRIDDCTNQDFTQLKEKNPAAIGFFEKYARDYETNAILISYKSMEDYEKGYEHDYGEYGLLDFEIWNDGLYICSYAAFRKESIKIDRFELQEYDGLVFSSIDKMLGNDLEIHDQEEWKELGETKGTPISKVYSVDTDKSGEITVYIPTKEYGEKPTIFIQHFENNQWWQYETNPEITRDKNYLMITFHGIPNGSFDFAVFQKGK